MTSAPNGILVVDKPEEISSHGVVSRVRRWCSTKKVGHAGTLDPLATGVLVLGIGRGTKLLTHMVGADKDYSAIIRLGASTPTDDAGAEPDRIADPQALARVGDADIRAGVSRLTGDIQQVPSAVSAIKVDGRRAYARVRAGEEVELAARPVTVSAFEVDSVIRGDATIDVAVRVTCSSGTYIRALARDLGLDLGVFGHLIGLRRTRVGPFGLDLAVALPEDPATAEPAPLIGLAQAASAGLPVVELDAAQRRDLIQGKFIVPPSGGVPDAPAGKWAGICSGELVAVLEARDGLLKTATGIATSAG